VENEIAIFHIVFSPEGKHMPHLYYACIQHSEMAMSDYIVKLMPPRHKMELKCY